MTEIYMQMAVGAMSAFDLDLLVQLTELVLQLLYFRSICNSCGSIIIAMLLGTEAFTKVSTLSPTIYSYTTRLLRDFAFI